MVRARIGIINELQPVFETCIDKIETEDNATISAWSKLSSVMGVAIKAMADALAASVDRSTIENNLLSSSHYISNAVGAFSNTFNGLSFNTDGIQHYREAVRCVMEKIGAIAHCEVHDDYWYDTGVFNEDSLDNAVMSYIKQNPLYSGLSDIQEIKNAIQYNLNDVPIERDCPICQKAYND